MLDSKFNIFSCAWTHTGGLRASTSTQGKGLLSNAMVGLAAVAGFLFIVFILLIVKRIFFKKEKWVYCTSLVWKVYSSERALRLRRMKETVRSLVYAAF